MLLVFLVIVPVLGLIVYHGLEQRNKERIEVLDKAIRLARNASMIYEYTINVIDLTNRFITRAEAPLLDAVLPWIFSARPDGFDGRDEQAVQFF